MAITEANVIEGMTSDGTFVAPGQSGSVVDVKPRYENFIGGH